MAAKPWLRDYFKRLAENIEKNQIINERSLSATVEIPLEGWYKGRTLLQALEYDKDYVFPQYPIQIGTSKPRVDFLLGRNADRWMLDLKKPGELCDRPKHIGQIQSYLGQEKVPLGILFNGTCALAYVNPDHEFISDIFKGIKNGEIEQIPELDIRNYPVVRVNMEIGDTKEIVRFFQMFRFDGGMPDIKALSRKLTSEYLKRTRSEGKAGVRLASITSIIKNILENPSEKLLETIVAGYPELSSLKVTPEEFFGVWSETIKNISKSKK